MTDRFRLTSDDFTESPSEDCYLAPDDPIHALKLAAATGMSVQSALAGQKLRTQMQAYEERQNSAEMRYAQEHNIKPGTPAWHALWGTR